MRRQYRSGEPCLQLMRPAPPNLYGIDLPPERVTAASNRINHLARTLKTKDETRTMDQLRADVYLDLLGETNAGKGRSSRHPRRPRHPRQVVGVSRGTSRLRPGNSRHRQTNHKAPVQQRMALHHHQPQRPSHRQWNHPKKTNNQPTPPKPNQHSGLYLPRMPDGIRDVACPPPNATSTTGHHGPKADPPQSTIFPPSAATTTTPDTKHTGNTSHYPTATTNGSAHSATHTPPAAGRHNHRLSLSFARDLPTY